MCRGVMGSIGGSGRLAVVVMLAMGCGDSGGSGSSGGCGSSGRCDINANATLCGDQITLECFDGTTPDAASQCELALEQDNEAIYCCTSAVEATAADQVGGWAGGGFGGWADGGFGGAGGGQAGFGGASM